MLHSLFVYGTLRKDYAASLPTSQRGHRVTPYDSLLNPYARFHSNAKVPGLLYNFGPYPGLIHSDDLSHFVIGELHHITNEDALWPTLDDYEGCSSTSEAPHLFTRQLTTATLDDGTQHPCWTYYYSHPLTPPARLIPSGNYL
ncbi:gamma-glutamylcyclotransferase family protein [Lacunimicrobium album]